MSLELEDAVDFEDLVERAIRSNYDPAVFDDIEDYRPAKAANIIEWMTDPRFLSTTLKPWPKQVYILASFFEDYCPMRFCSDMTFFQNMFEEPLDEIRDRITFLENGVCPRCGGTRLQYQEEGLFSAHNDLVGCAGQRSGKTYMVGSLIATYHLHRLLCIPDPLHYYRLEDDTLHFTFTALTKEQAQKTLWTKFYKAFNKSPWFKDYNNYLREEEKRLGAMLIDVKKTFVAYIHKSIGLSFSDAHQGKLRGLTRVLAAEDEIGWMDDHAASKKIVANAQETYEAMQKSLRTIRSSANRLRQRGVVDVPDGLHLTVSSPARVTDKIMSLVRQSDEVPTMFAFHEPTWKINPNIPFSDLQPEFAKDEVKARRDYGADPPFATSPFWTDDTALEKIANGKPVVEGVNDVYEDGHGFQYVYVKMGRVLQQSTVPHCLSIDAGESYNSFALSLTRLTPDGHLVVAQTFEAAPRDDMTVHFQLILRDLIFPLLDAFIIRDVIYDRWNSTSHIQDIRDHETPYAASGVRAFRNSPKYEEGMAFRSELTTMQLVEPENDISRLRVNYEQAIQDAPNTHLLYQILSVRVVGRSIQKGLNAQDDIFRATWNAHAWMKKPENIEAYTNHSLFNTDPSRPKRAGAVIFASRGSQGGLTTLPSSNIATVGLRSSKAATATSPSAVAAVGTIKR